MATKRKLKQQNELDRADLIVMVANFVLLVLPIVMLYINQYKLSFSLIYAYVMLMLMDISLKLNK